MAAHCPSVAESAALWGQPGLAVLSTYLRQGNDATLREAAAAALDAILRLHKIQAVKEVLAKGMRIRGLLDKYGETLRQPRRIDAELPLTLSRASCKTACMACCTLLFKVCCGKAW